MNDLRRFLYRLQQYVHGNMTCRMDTCEVLKRLDVCKKEVGDILNVKLKVLDNINIKF